MINLDELRKFIAEARKNTYAGGGKSVENPFLSGSFQLEYESGDYFYRDIYFAGKDNFSGQEVFYFQNAPVWSMVYCGSAEPKEVSEFLKKSLSVLAKKCRFNEECGLKEGDFKYENEGKGTLERFHGEESIFIRGEKVYNLRYQGGLVSK